MYYFDDVTLNIGCHGTALSLLQLQEYPENIGAKFRLEGAELAEVSELPSEEAEVSEQPLEGVSGKGSEWKEHVVVLGAAGRGLDQEVLQSIS